VVVSKINENKSETYGFDAQTEQYVDMLSAGIVDRRRSCGCLGRGCYDHDRGHGRGGSEEEGGSGHVRRRNGRHRLLISRNIETGAAAVGAPHWLSGERRHFRGSTRSTFGSNRFNWKGSFFRRSSERASLQSPRGSPAQEAVTPERVLAEFADERHLP
jgi:hypothetical protein